MSLPVHPSPKSSLRQHPPRSKPCIEPLEGRTLLAANPANVQQAEYLNADATFVTEQTAAEWGLTPLSGNPAEPIIVTAQVGAGSNEYTEVNGDGANDLFKTGAVVSISAENADTGYVYFRLDGNSYDVTFNISRDGRSATLDAVIPSFEYVEYTELNVSVHLEWTATRAAAGAAGWGGARR